ncbi:MAG: hypothetical protein K0S70_2089 [Microbacterium sp.]|jgi:hypothetical protein|nr:hypothetical protein [Microbacterium sp.]
MSISLLGIIFLGLGVIGWLFSERLFIATIAASAVFSTSAAVTIAGNGIPPFHVVGALAVVSAIVSMLRGAKVRHPAVPLLVLLLVWSVLVTAWAPTLFAGIPILDPRAGIDRQVYDPTPLAYTPSMAAQVAYLIVGVGVAIYLAQRPRLTPAVITIPITIGTALSALRLVPGLAEPMDAIFRNSASAGYLGFVQRHFGVFAEPSYLAVFSIAALAFTVYRLRASRGTERVALVAVVLLAPVNLFAASSGTGALGFVLLVGIALVYYGTRFLFARMKLNPWWLLLPLGVVIALITPNPLTASIAEVLDDKSGSASFRNRFASDLFSLDLTLDTFGIGVGLGASRPSSFATLVLSNLGVIGFALLAVALCLAIARVRITPGWTPAAVALFALVLAKVIAEPALSTPLLWLLVGACLYAGNRARNEEKPPLSSTVATQRGLVRQSARNA